jgi:N-acetylglucosaminyl-diphospho-decaprenol L-rhamnosyltransferase
MNEAKQGNHVDCAAIIVTYNSARDVTGLLESLPAAAEGLSIRVILVDNGSTDDTVKQARSYPNVVCVETGANLGYAGGINVGRQYVGDCASIAILNPDLVLEPGSLREMFTALADPAIGLVAPMLLDSDGQLYHSLRREPSLAGALGDALIGRFWGGRPHWMSETIRDSRAYDHQHAIDWAGGAALLISAACDQAIGAWDERFFLYLEEVDYAARARSAGYRMEYVPRARVRHRGAGSGQSPALYALMAVNRIRYCEKHGKPARIMRAIVLTHELIRSSNASHRAALRAVARRSSWEPLISGLKGRTLLPVTIS